jgi:hypothetical protein
MKSLFFVAILIVAFSTASFSRQFVAEGKTYTTFGDYKIEKTDALVTIDGKELPAYLVSYQSSTLEVKVVIMEEKKHKDYIVLSKKLSVQYVDNKKYFGVEKVSKSLKAEGYSLTDAALNKSEYFSQKVLNSGNSSDIENIRLIAAYFPMLLKETRKATASM